MAARLLDYDPVTRTKVLHDYDHTTTVTTIYEEQDERPIVETLQDFKRVTNNSPIVSGNSRLNDYERAGIKKGWYHVARFSNQDIVKMKAQGIDLFKIDKCEWTKKKVYQILNSSGKEKWRTGNGRL